ncbi:MAG: hypothetical protein K2H85_03070, partial [Allobaculum sp.]|nr:hypothetical protein [Allobaculum sp.]
NSIWDSEDRDYLLKLDTTTDIDVSTICQVTIDYSRPEETTDQNVFDTDIHIEDIDFINLEEAINETEPHYDQLSHGCRTDWEKIFARQRSLVEPFDKLLKLYNLSPYNQFSMPEIAIQVKELQEKVRRLSEALRRKC